MAVNITSRLRPGSKKCEVENSTKPLSREFGSSLVLRIELLGISSIINDPDLRS
jgi:hypothetical protein